VGPQAGRKALVLLTITPLACRGDARRWGHAHPCARGISASLHVIASIEEPALIERILAHVRGKAGSDTAARVPPSTGPPVSA
jgi:hypothetical protein